MKCFNCGRKTPKSAMVKLSNIALGYVYYCERCAKFNKYNGKNSSVHRPNQQNTIKNKYSTKMKGIVPVKQQY